MALTHEKRLERFIRNQAFGTKWEDKLDKFVFNHAPQGTKPKVIHEYKVGPDGIDEEQVLLLVEEFMEVLVSDATGMGNWQRYTIEAYREGGVSGGRFVAKLYGESDEENEGDPMDTEGPTTKGLTAQAMRHAEQYMKMTVGSFGVMLTQMQRMLQQSGEMTERLQKEKWEMLQTLELAHGKQHEREMEALQLSAEQDRKDKLSDTLMSLAPAAVNGLVGRRLLPEKNSPDQMIIDNLLKSFSNEQLQKILPHLRPEQAIPLLELLKAKRAQEEALANATEGKPKNGES